jgi:hypothetical protein
MKALNPKVKIERPEREQASREDALKRVKAFPKRKEKLIAAIRKGTHVPSRRSSSMLGLA